jgi:hypothetical protein
MLVSGASGFLRSHLCYYFLVKGHRDLARGQSRHGSAEHRAADQRPRVLAHHQDLTLVSFSRSPSTSSIEETIPRVTEPRSEIVLGSPLLNDLQVRQPDITRAGRISGREPEVALDDGLRRTIASLASPEASVPRV